MVGEILPDAVRAAAGEIARVANEVRTSAPTGVGSVASAFEGSASGTAGTALAGAWTTSFEAWATDAEAHAQSMRAAADNWERTDGAVAQDFTTPWMSGC